MTNIQRSEPSIAEGRAISNPNTTPEAIDMVISCYCDFINSATWAQSAHVIERKLRALIIATEESFKVFNSNTPFVPSSVMAAMRMVRVLLLDNLHSELNVIKFGINPVQSVIDNMIVWVAFCRVINNYEQPNDQCEFLTSNIK
jgi:hypothetical protein